MGTGKLFCLLQLHYDSLRRLALAAIAPTPMRYGQAALAPCHRGPRCERPCAAMSPISPCDGGIERPSGLFTRTLCGDAAAGLHRRRDGYGITLRHVLVALRDPLESIRARLWASWSHAGQPLLEETPGTCRLHVNPLFKVPHAHYRTPERVSRRPCAAVSIGL